MIKVVMSEMEGNTAALSGEGVMESVGSPKEEVNLNTPVPAPYIIPSSSLYHLFFPQVSNPASEEAKENVSGEGKGREGKRRENLSCQKRRETTQLYLGR